MAHIWTDKRPVHDENKSVSSSNGKQVQSSRIRSGPKQPLGEVKNTLHGTPFRDVGKENVAGIYPGSASTSSKPHPLRSELLREQHLKQQKHRVKKQNHKPPLCFTEDDFHLYMDPPNRKCMAEFRKKDSDVYADELLANMLKSMTNMHKMEKVFKVWEDEEDSKSSEILETNEDEIEELDSSDWLQHENVHVWKHEDDNMPLPEFKMPQMDMPEIEDFGATNNTEDDNIPLSKFKMDLPEFEDFGATNKAEMDNISLSQLKMAHMDLHGIEDFGDDIKDELNQSFFDLPDFEDFGCDYF